MENVTTNYLVGEQQVCNTWANYINSSSLTAEQAIGFVRDSITSPEIMAHILVAGDSGVSGLSTTARPQNPDDYSVSYENVSLYSHGFDELLSEEAMVNVTRTFTNPVNARQSIAFCNSITLRCPRVRSTPENSACVLI